MHANRDMELVLKKGFKQFPIVTIVGPRQSGKTTLLEINDPKQISRDPLRGQLFENLVIVDILKYS